MMRGCTAARRGFTLLELSVVLGIIALIAGVGLNMANGALKAANRITTQERLNSIKFALDSFAKTYGFLPCPSDRAALPGTSGFGNEARNPASPANCVANSPGLIEVSGAFWLGAVPVRTLGLPDNYAADAWGNKFTYGVPDVLKSSPSSYSTQVGNISIRYNNGTAIYNHTAAHWSGSYSAVANSGGLAQLTITTGTIPSVGTLVSVAGGVYKGSYIVQSATGTTITLLGSTYSANDSGILNWQVLNSRGAAYAVVSSGANGMGAYPLNGTSIPASKACGSFVLETPNCNGSAIFDDVPYNDGAEAAFYFDDFIIWGSNDLLGAQAAPIMYSACPTGICEPWCATCAVNYPGGGTALPPASITAGAVLYKKIIMSDATSCSASCIWGGVSASGYQRAP